MTDPFDRDVWSVLGMPLDNLTLAEAVKRIELAIERGERLSFVTPNVNILVRALKDPTAMAQIVRTDMSLADGAPVVWLARQLGMPLQERVAGSDLFEAMRRDTRPEALPIRVFFFGGRDGAAEAACAVLAAEAGRLIPAGWHNPGFGTVEEMTSPEIQSKIKAAKPDFIVVSLGAAKGQAWIEANLEALEAPVIAHLGAVVDFVAGTISRAPHLVSRLGLEWVWRIFAEPSLWKRYWRDGRALLGLVGQRLNRLKRIGKAPSEPQKLEISSHTSEPVHTLTLRGDAVHASVPQLNLAFREAVVSANQLEIDLQQVRALDAAALGQIHLLQHHFKADTSRLTLQIPAHLRPALSAAGMS